MSDTKGRPNGSTHHKHDDGSSGRAFTVEQKEAVLRVRKCKGTDFYAILGLEEVRTTCTDGEIKKAYRKLSLLTHPDKNGYTGADEAFKMVSRAFQILSDADKRAKYDRFGGDPDNRFSSASASGASPFSGFASQRGGGGGRGGGPMFEEEISPEELFRQFFGGGAFGGGPFGGMGMGMGGPGFVFNLGGGGPGIRVHQFGGDRPRRRPHNHEQAANNAGPASPLQAIQGLLPLLLLFILPIISSLFSGGPSGPSGPSVRFDKAVPPLTLKHTSAGMNVPYWVNPSEVQEYTPKKWKALDKVVEGRFIAKISGECEWEHSQRQRLMHEAQGFFFTDQEKLDQARGMAMPQCEKLKSYGYHIPGL